MPTIFDINQLQPLQAIARDHGVSFTLHGGVAFRFALKLGSNDQITTSPVDLFDLTPFTSDVDLVHSGFPTKSIHILDSILLSVPSADCFRWDVRSISQDDPYRQAAPFGNVIPARRVALSSQFAVDITDTANGLKDIRSRQFRYFRNPLFHESPLYRSGHDLEVFSALLYLQTLFEARLSQSEILEQPGRRDVEAIFLEATADATIRRLQQHAYLRTRLRYLISNSIASTSRQCFREVTRAYKLDEFIRAAAPSVPAIASNPPLRDYLMMGDSESNSHFVLGPTACLGGDILRLPLVTKDWTAGKYAHKQLSLPPSMLGPGQCILMASPVLPVEPGSSVSSVGSSLGPQEFLHFDLPAEMLGATNNIEPAPRLSKLTEAELSGVLALKSSKESSWKTFALPCVVSHRQPLPSDAGMEALLIRMNCFGVLESMARTEKAEMQFFLVGWTGLDR